MFSSIYIQSYLWKTGRGDEMSPPPVSQQQICILYLKIHNRDVPFSVVGVMSLGSPSRGFSTCRFLLVSDASALNVARRHSRPPSLSSKSQSHGPCVVKNEKHSSVTHLPSRYFSARSQTRLSPLPRSAAASRRGKMKELQPASITTVTEV